MYKVHETEMTEMSEGDFEDLIELAKENIKIGNCEDVPIATEEKIEEGELPNHITRIKVADDIIIYVNKYVNTTSNPLIHGYNVLIFIKQ